MDYSLFDKLKEPKIDMPKFEFGTGSPHILIIAGVHGDEPTSIQVTMELISFLEDIDINGSITILPLVNKLAFFSKRRTSIDKKDLNRSFPGNQNGTITEKLANEVWNIATEVDYILDLHCCGTYSSPYLLTTHNQHEHSRKYISNFGLDVCVQSSGQEGQLFVEASRIGIPSGIIEIPGGGEDGWISQEMIPHILSAIKQGLAKLGFITIEIDNEIRPRFASELIEIHATKSGLLNPIAHYGEEVSEEEIIFTINKDEILMPEAGKLVFSSPMKFVFQGDIIGRYVNFNDEE